MRGGRLKLRLNAPSRWLSRLKPGHALEVSVDETGKRLAIGSTTGNLWTSANGGESWSNASTHLPPIAQVAFA